MRTSGEKTFSVAVTFTVHAQTDAHLQTRRAIRDEVTSWLESLNATVRDIHVTSSKLLRLKEGDK